MKNITTVTTLICFLVVVAQAQEGGTSFKCTSSPKCTSLIDYVSPNATTLSKISTLFGIKNLRSILGANSLPLNTKASLPISAKQTIKIPFPCACRNGTGISDGHPVYVVKPDGLGLDHIARDIFSALVTYQQIAEVNNITNPDKIDVGQRLWIPLPCSCDQVAGMEVVHYGHVVKAGSSVELIAKEFGTSEETLLKLNGIANAKDLQAGAVLDVPLPACESTISKTSLDNTLLVPHGTYALTANNCVQCKCDLTRSSLLRCEPSPKDVKVQKWSQCPAIKCVGDALILGDISSNTTSKSSMCGQVCTYAGFNNDTILTDLRNVEPCGPGPQVTPSSNVSKLALQGSVFWLLLTVLNSSVLLSGFLL